MGDEGLPLGCALTVHKKLNPDFQPFKLTNTFLGTSYSDDEFEVDETKYNIRPLSNNQLSYELKEGKVIGWFQGRYEHGPRALCNRSIIADPSIPGTYKKVNDRLQRNDFMPFAPVVIDKYADKVFKADKSKYTAEFMTMLYDTHEDWIDKIPAVVHPIDKTARIQIVTDKSNHKFYNLINKFNELTGIPVLLNTSFNVHGEPIVCHPNEAFVHLDNNIVDILVINNKVYSKK
jgi:carbamoyltransferase